MQNWLKLKINFLNKSLKDIQTHEIIFLYFVYIAFIIFLSLTFTYVLVHKFEFISDNNNQLILKNIPFGYGELINNLFYDHSYVQKYHGNVDFYLARLPFLPIFSTLILKISTNIYYFLLIKNLIFFTFLFTISILSLKNRKVFDLIFILLLFSFIPYNLQTQLNFWFADSYTSILLPTLFLAILSEGRKKFFFITIIIIILYLIKTSMFFLTFILIISLLIIEKKEKKISKYFLIIGYLLAIFSWGTFGYIKTGKFPFGSKLSSINSEALSISFNKSFHKYYPLKSVDLIDFGRIQEDDFENEWEYYEYYTKRNKKYLKENIDQVFLDSLLKMKFILFNIRRDAVFPNKAGIVDNPIMYSHVMNRLFFIISLLVLVHSFVRGFKDKDFKKVDVYFFLILVGSIFPHIIAWATSKHLVGIFIISYIYLYFKIKNRFLKI